jgi:hypothetical protein
MIRYYTRYLFSLVGFIFDWGNVVDRRVVCGSIHGDEMSLELGNWSDEGVMEIVGHNLHGERKLGHGN